MKESKRKDTIKSLLAKRVDNLIPPIAIRSS